MKNYFMSVIAIVLILLYGAHGEGYSYKQATSSDVSLKINNNNSNTKNLSQANLYTGDLVVNYPITNFGGINLSLIYNSNVHNLIRTKNEIMQSGWVGLGWKLEIGCIVGDINNTKDLSDDKYYYIDQNGTNELILIGDNKFKLKDYKFWDITRIVDDQNNLRGWEIIKEDGTIYRFGNYDSGLEQELKFLDPANSPYEPTYATRYKLGYIGKDLYDTPYTNHLTNKAFSIYNELELFAIEWDVSVVEDIYGNITTVYYQPELEYLEDEYCKSTYPYTRASYIKKIVDFRGRSIEFVLDTMEVNKEYIAFNSSFSQQNYSTQYLKYIKMFDEEGNLIKQYELNYVLEDLLSLNTTKRYLVSIQETYPDGKSKKTCFNYYGVNGQDEGINLGALKEIIYPTGGTVDYEYKSQTIDNVILNKEESYNNNTPPSFERDELEKIGFAGSDFKVIQLSDNTLQVFRWGIEGWYLDKSFPNDSPVIKYWVYNDYIVVKQDNSMFVYKRNNNDWHSFEIDVAGIEDAGVIGLGSDFFVIKHNKIKDSISGELQYNKSVIRWEINSWKIDSKDSENEQMYYYISEDEDLIGQKKIACGQRFFYEEYKYGDEFRARAWIWNGETWVKSGLGFISDADGSHIIPYCGKDYTIAYLPDRDDGKPLIRIDNFSSTTLDYYEKANHGIYPGDDYFVTLDSDDNINFTVKIFTYIGEYDWDIKNVQDLFQDVVNFKNAKIAIGDKFFILGWITADNKGRLDIFKLNPAYTWEHTDSIITTEDLSISGSHILPILTMDRIIAEVIIPNVKYKVLAITKENNDWTTELLIDESNYLEEKNSFTQAGNNFITSINKPTSSPVDIKSYSFKQGYGQNAEPIYKNNPWDYPLYKMTISDKKGNKFTYTYEFLNGVYDASVNFAKYNKVVINQPTNNGKIVTYFYNDLSSEDTEEFVDVNNFEELDGSPYLQKVFDANNNCITEKKYIWKVVDKGDGCYFTELQTLINKDLNSIETKTNFLYDDQGRVTEVATYEPNSEDIKTKLKYQYIDTLPLTNKHILNWIDNVTLLDADNNTLKYSEYEYDFDNLFLKKEKSWLNKDGDYDVDVNELIATSEIKSINEYGQIIHINNPVTNVPASIIYDPVNNLPLATITNAEPEEVFVDHFDHTDIFNSATGQWYVTNNDRNNWEVRYGKLIWNNTDVSLEDCSINRAIDQTNFIAEFDVRVAEAPVSGGDWAGFHFRKTSIDHQVSSSGSSGYVVFLRRNGIVELDKIHPDNGITMLGDRYELANRNGDWNYVHGSEHHIRVVAEGSNIKVYVDGVLAIDVTDSDFNGSYCGFSTYRTKSMFDNIRIYPSDAYCTSRSYDSKTLQVKEKIDADGLITRYYYDDFYRLAQVRDTYYNVISERAYYLSKELNEEYNENDPNFVRDITYNSELIEGKYSNLAPNFGFELDHKQGNFRPSFWKKDIYYGPAESYSIVINESNNTQCIKIDNSVGEGSPETVYVSSSPLSESEKYFTIDYPQTVTMRTYADWLPGDNGTLELGIQDGDVLKTIRGSNNSADVYLEDASLTYYLKITPDEPDMNIDGYVEYEGDRRRSIVSDYIPVDANTDYYLSGEIKTTEGGNARAYLGVCWKDINLETIKYEYVATSVNPGNTWTSYSGIKRSPENAVYAEIWAINFDNNDIAWFDNIQFVRSNQDENPPVQQHVVTSYSDGLGREFQTQSIKYSPADNHYKLVITGKEYDEMGRPYRSWLPIEIDQYDLPADHSLLSFICDYQSRVHVKYDEEADYTPWYEIAFTNDPTSRISTSYSPGANYNYQGTRHITASYSVNTADDNVYDYPDANSVFKTTFTDNTFGDGEIVNVSFTDPFGNVVETIRDKDGLDYHTIYRYDVQNRLISTFAPQGYEIYEDEKQEEYKEIIVHPQNLIVADVGSQLYLQSIPATDSAKVVKVKMYFTANTTDAEPRVDYTIEYYLNSWQNLGSFTLADSGSQGIQVLSHNIPQDAGMVRVTIDYIEPVDKIDRAQAYSNYTVEVAVGYQQPAVLDDFESRYSYNTLDQIISEENPDDGKTEYKYDLNGNLRFKRDERYASNSKMLYFQYDKFNRLIEIGECNDQYFTQSYAEGSLPEEETDSDNELVKYFYDDGGNDNPNGRNLKGRLSHKMFKNHNHWSYTAYSYDENGQIEWIIQKIYNQIEDRYLEKKIEYDYDLQGNVVKINYNPGESDALYYYYEYDPTGALMAVYTNNIDDRNTARKELTYNKTDDTGRITQILLGKNVQILDYQYDIHGWLTHINNTDQIDNDDENDMFAMRLYHDENEEEIEFQYYNGLISAYDVRYPHIDGMTEDYYRYTFNYDKAFRLKSVRHLTYQDNYWQENNRFLVDNITYNANGNILSLRRYDQNGNVLHNFDYNYATNTNKLRNIDGNGDDYTYYPNGNLEKDVLKGLTIYYNYLNLPSSIVNDNGATVKRGYDDFAQRIYKQNADGSAIFYIRGIDGQVMAEYNENNQLLLWRLGNFGHREPDGHSYYYLKDHLGNVRVSVKDDGTISSKDDYYPFGLIMDGMSYNAGNANSRLKYSSKELDEALNYNQYAFGWRDYDPKIGRWHVKDLLYFLHYDLNPYNFVENNPINGVDLAGLTDFWIIHRFRYSVYYNESWHTHTTEFRYLLNGVEPMSTTRLTAPGHLSPLIDGGQKDNQGQNRDSFDNPFDDVMSGGISGDAIDMPYFGFGYGNIIHGGGGSGRHKGSSDNRKNENYTKNRVSHIITISVNGAWVRTFGVNFEAGIAINLTTREMTPYLKFGPSLGEGKTIGIELAYQRQSWKDFFGIGAEFEGSFGKLGINIPIAGRSYFDLGDFVGFGGSWGIGGGSIINFQGPAVHTNPISLYSIYLYAKFFNLIR